METSYIIRQKIKAVIKKADPDAEVILFGSRARGSAQEDSDWDIMILVDKPEVSVKDEQFFRHKLFDLELETSQVISTFVYSKKDWKSRMSVTPLFANVQREGIYL